MRMDIPVQDGICKSNQIHSGLQLLQNRWDILALFGTILFQCYPVRLASSLLLPHTLGCHRLMLCLCPILASPSCTVCLLCPLPVWSEISATRRNYFSLGQLILNEGLTKTIAGPHTFSYASSGKRGGTHFQQRSFNLCADMPMHKSNSVSNRGNCTCTIT